MFIIRDANELSGPDPGAKLIKARDFWAFKEAETALADAHDEKRRILLSARDAYQAERERGYAEGHESARLQQSGRMMEIVNQTVDYFARLEADMVELVLDAVRKVVSDFDDRQRLTTVVKNCLDLLRQQKQLSLSVHPSQVVFLRSQVQALCVLYPSVAHIDVHGDARLAIDACLVESDIGVVEASLSGQFEILRQTLNAVIAPVLSDDGDGRTLASDRESAGTVGVENVEGSVIDAPLATDAGDEPDDDEPYEDDEEDGEEEDDEEDEDEEEEDYEEDDADDDEESLPLPKRRPELGSPPGLNDPSSSGRAR